MWVVASQLVLDYFGNQNIRHKHRQIDDLCKEIKRKYNISALEIADFDDLERCCIGLSFVCPSTWSRAQVDSLAKKIIEEIDSTAFARLVSEDVDIVDYRN